MANIRFQTDEHVSSKIARRLRALGLDAVTAHESGLRGASDLTQLTAARISGRVMVTQDDDYLALSAAGVAHAGIAYCAQGSRTIGEMVEMLEAIGKAMEPEEMIGRVQYL